MNVLSLDMGGSHIACAVVSDREILAQDSIPSDGGRMVGPLLPRLEQTAVDLLRKAHLTAEQCSGMVIGFPGVVDFRTGTVYRTFKKYEDIREMDLAGWSKRTFGLPTYMESDSRVALLGEWYAGAAQGYGDIVMLTLGTGIGGAAMMHGRLVRGKHAAAGSMGGHFPVEMDGRICVCGNPGCAEAEASGWTLPQVARDWPGFAASTLSKAPSLDCGYLFLKAAEGDRVAAEIRDRFLHVWGANAIANYNAYEPDLIVVGGGIMRSSEQILPFLKRYIDRYAFAPLGKPEIRAAGLGNDAGLLGAVPLFQEAANAAKG